jgi:hypothetical protein
MIWVIIWFICGIIGYQIDFNKGNSGCFGSLLGFLLGPLGLLLIYFSSSNSKVLRQRSGDTKVCPFCKEYIKFNADYCKHCHNRLFEVIEPIENNSKDYQYSDYYPKNSKSDLRYVDIAIATIVSLIVISLLINAIVDFRNFSWDKYLKRNSSELNTVGNSNENLSTEEKELKLIKSIQDELTILENGIDYSQYRGSLSYIKKELKLFNKWSKIIEDNQTDSSKEVKKILGKFKNKVISNQVKEFPILRKEFSKVIGSIGLKDDIEVISFGPKNTNIKFIGSYYALKSNISLNHSKISSVLGYLRFKKAQYLWFKYDEDYVTYKIESSKDNEIDYSYSLENSNEE